MLRSKHLRVPSPDQQGSLQSKEARDDFHAASFRSFVVATAVCSLLHPLVCKFKYELDVPCYFTSNVLCP